MQLHNWANESKFQCTYTLQYVSSQDGLGGSKPDSHVRGPWFKPRRWQHSFHWWRFTCVCVFPKKDSGNLIILSTFLKTGGGYGWMRWKSLNIWPAVVSRKTDSDRMQIGCRLKTCRWVPKVSPKSHQRTHLQPVNFQTFLRPCALLFGFKFEGMQHGILYVQKAQRLFNKENGQ